MKRSILLAGIIFCGMAWSFSATAASTNNGSTNEPNINANASTFTNTAGQSFTAEQLAQNLKDLRRAIEQTLPMLDAVAQTYSNSTSPNTGAGSWKGRLSDFVSGALSREGQTNSQSSSAISSLAGTLRGVLGTNSNTTAASGSDAATVQKITTLENQLKPVMPTLDQLNVATAPARATGSGTTLTPTGR